MATSNSIAAISRRLYRTLISNQIAKPAFNHPLLKSFFSTEPSVPEYTSDLDNLPISASDSEPAGEPLSSSSPSEELGRQRLLNVTKLEDGLDIGIYKAILVGQVGQIPIQKRMKNGRTVTMTTVGTGGIRNERIPFPNEEPREYADRCNVQWHRVSIFPDRLGEVVMKNCQPGSILYLEGNLETMIFTDNITGLVRRIREIAVRRNGRVVFLGNGSDFTQPSQTELRGVGYF